MVVTKVLIWIINSDRFELLRYMESNISNFNGKIKFPVIDFGDASEDFNWFDYQSTTLIKFLSVIPEIYRMLSDDNKSEIRVLAEKSIDLFLLSGFLYTETGSHSKTQGKKYVF